MKYEKGQFGEPWRQEPRTQGCTCEGDCTCELIGSMIVDDKHPLPIAESYVHRDRLFARAVACVNALDGLNPEAVKKIAEWWRRVRDKMAHPSELATLNAFLDQLIGADDVDNT